MPIYLYHLKFLSTINVKQSPNCEHNNSSITNNILNYIMKLVMIHKLLLVVICYKKSAKTMRNKPNQGQMISLYSIRIF
jgi:hypothetical protein